MKCTARFLVCLLILTAGWLVAPRVYAQATQPPFVDIIQVDRSQTPTIQLSAVGGNLSGDLGTLPLQLFEGDQSQTLTADRTALAGIQLALVVDPREILVAGTSGQTHHAEVAGAALGLIENNVITRNVDLLAVYSRQPNGALQTIQDWTKEPNLIFNSIVQDKPEDASSAAPLTDLLLQALDQFQTADQSTGLARSLLLFSTGASVFDLAKVVAKANEQHVYIHTVELAAPNQATSRASALQQLAQQTHGQAVFLASVQNLDGLWPVLSDLRFQRTVVYQSSSTTPAPLRLQLTLPSGSTVETQLNATNPTTATRQPAPVTTATVAANPVITKAAPAAALVATNTVAATAVDEPIAATVATTAPATESGPVVDTTQSERIVIPGTSLTLPRGALQLALPVLILLLAYFVYRDLRERKARATQNTNLNRRLNRRDSQLYALNDPVGDLKPLPKNKPKTGNYDLQTDDNLPVQAAEPQRAPAYAARAHDDDDPKDDDQNDDATIVPRPAFGDDEATYRLSEQIKQPIIGSFVRVAGNPTLPNELPIYGLSPARGEIRQIHIGRHSKNNTVVINDKSISREHAVILQKEGRLYLRDNASTAGTFLNGKRLQPGEELLLRHNDLASFGEVVYEFHAQGEDEATVAGE
ncbi:MAG: FHA domain-containing protein [Chloroflexi bacterium]|nr:FHA domain-containing protein [Chloroflexota bacterium]